MTFCRRSTTREGKLHGESMVSAMTYENEIYPTGRIYCNETRDTMLDLSDIYTEWADSQSTEQLTKCTNASQLVAKISSDSSLGYSDDDERIHSLLLPRFSDSAVARTQGTRRTMEDQHTMMSEGIPFFGVYDGHGGTQCAEYLRDHLHTMILNHPDIKSDPEKAIRESIITADSDFLQRSEVETNESGSVCAVALILDDELVIGNVGDCEAVLSRDSKPFLLTVKHNLQNNPAELERIKEIGGKVFHNRVGHPLYNMHDLKTCRTLAVTRAIGDAGFKLSKYTDGKPSGIIAVPDTRSTKLLSGDEFVVIGCDGLWDVMSYEEVIDFCLHRIHAKLSISYICDCLIDTAVRRGSTDNVTVIIVVL